MISDFITFPKMLLRWLKFGAFHLTAILTAYYKKITPLFFNLLFLLLLNERGLSRESWSAVFHPSTKCISVMKVLLFGINPKKKF